MGQNKIIKRDEIPAPSRAGFSVSFVELFRAVDKTGQPLHYQHIIPSQACVCTCAHLIGFSVICRAFLHIHGPPRISFLSCLGRSRRSRSDRISGRSISLINSVNRTAGHAIHKRGLVYRIIIISIRKKNKKTNQMSLRNLYRISLEHFNCLSSLQEILFYYFPTLFFYTP
jgi:hypothetical protein